VTWAADHRPKQFADLVAQDHVGAVLPRMVFAARQGARKFPPALVLYGPRGTGKTSVARIIAKALNCTSSSVSNVPPGEPCAVCPTCLGIDAGTSPGVTEIDMASHGGVEDMRRLKQDAAYSVAEFWRVYLMDEVHSASRDAFNALLKLLEEPPPRTLFVLVTTEPERIPDTIRSRSMEFEFRRLAAQDIAARLRVIADLESTNPASDVLIFLAARARGGMRDAIMALEQVVAAWPSQQGQPTQATYPTLEFARQVLGASDAPERLLSAALAGDVGQGIQCLQTAAYGGTSPATLADELLGGLTALVAVRTGLPAADVQDAPVSPGWLQAHAPTASIPVLLAGVRELWNARARIRGHDPASPTHLTAAYLSLCQVLAHGSQSPVSRFDPSLLSPSLSTPLSLSENPRSMDRGPETSIDPEAALDELANL
jgi:DNA polymerase-3 subunit gamma/tau